MRRLLAVCPAGDHFIVREVADELVALLLASVEPMPCEDSVCAASAPRGAKERLLQCAAHSGDTLDDYRVEVVKGGYRVVLPVRHAADDAIDALDATPTCGCVREYWRAVCECGDCHVPWVDGFDGYPKPSGGADACPTCGKVKTVRSTQRWLSDDDATRLSLEASARRAARLEKYIEQKRERYTQEKNLVKAATPREAFTDRGLEVAVPAYDTLTARERLAAYNDARKRRDESWREQKAASLAASLSATTLAKKVQHA